MKDVGRTEKGAYIVEISAEEYAQFSLLAQSVEGKSVYEVNSMSREYVFQTGFDFQFTFEAVRAFYEANFRITELQRLINEIKESLNV